MEIRPMEKTDLPACEQVFIRVYNSAEFGDAWSDDAAGKRLADLCNTPESLAFVAEDEDGVAGFLLGRVEQWFAEGQFQIQEMCVVPEQRHRGIGTALLESLLEELVKRNMSAVYLYAGRNTPAGDFFRTCGFFQNERMVQFVQRL